MEGELLSIKGTADTPAVTVSKTAPHLCITGVSMPENSFAIRWASMFEESISGSGIQKAKGESDASILNVST